MLKYIADIFQLVKLCLCIEIDVNYAFNRSNIKWDEVQLASVIFDVVRALAALSRIFEDISSKPVSFESVWVNRVHFNVLIEYFLSDCMKYVLSRKSDAFNINVIYV